VPPADLWGVQASHARHVEAGGVEQFAIFALRTLSRPGLVGHQHEQVLQVRERRAREVVVQHRFADQERPAGRERRRAVAQDRAADLVAPVVQDVAEEDHVGAGGVRPRNQIRGNRCEPVVQPGGGDVLPGDDTDRFEVGDDAAEMRMLDADRDRLPARSARHIHDAATGCEVESFGNQLPLRHADGVHQLRELAERRWIGIQGRERIGGIDAKRLAPARRILPQCLREVARHGVERVDPRHRAELHGRSRGAELAHLRVAETVTVALHQAQADHQHQQPAACDGTNADPWSNVIGGGRCQGERVEQAQIVRRDERLRGHERKRHLHQAQLRLRQFRAVGSRRHRHTLTPMSWRR